LYGDAIVARDGQLTVPDGPGLGVEPDLDVIKEYAVQD
jgi:L-alanine-DL-glutamate epimerase-like enolase superfamily enzyme